MLCFALLSKLWSVGVGRVSFKNIFGPLISGPKAQTLLAARISQSNLDSKRFFTSFWLLTSTSYLSTVSEIPFSKGPAKVFSLFFLLGVSA